MTDTTKERPILFSAPMVRALLAGTKTQTRRALATQPGDGAEVSCARASLNRAMTKPVIAATWYVPAADGSTMCICPYGMPGGRLWVRESWRAADHLNKEKPSAIPPGSPVIYEADQSGDLPPFNAGRGRPGMFMPRWASRILLEVTEVRVERLQDCSEADARAEGIERSGECNWRDYLDHPHNDFTSACRSYRSLWDQINGAGAWEANPWVWAVSFRRVEAAAP